MKITDLFPIPVCQTDLHRELTEDELKFFALEKEKERKINLGNSYSKNKYILNSPELSNLKKDLTDLVNEYLHNVWKPKYDVEAYITISWVNYTERGQFHHAHEHSNSAISGVYYIDTDENDTITYVSPQMNILRMKIAPTEWNTWNSEKWTMLTPKNSVMLFPSTLKHSVDETSNPKTRTSLGFNTFLRGRLDDTLAEIVL